MGAFDGDTLADRFRNHFGHTDHLYGALLAGMADDWEVGGVTREIFDGWEDAFPQPKHPEAVRALLERHRSVTSQEMH